MRMRRPPSRFYAPIALAGPSLSVFVAVASFHVRLPGLYYDELFQETTALAFVKGGLASPVAVAPGSQISLFGHPLPLMANAYIGAVKTVAFAPVAALFGITPDSVRLFTIGVSALALVATAAFARRLFPHGAVAAIAALLLATDPSYVFYSRVDFGPSVFMFLLKAVALWQLAAWWQTRRTRSLLIGVFALGLGVYDKVNFLWIVAGVVGAALLVAPRRVVSRLGRRELQLGLAAFALGCLPLIVYNVSWPPRTLRPLLHGTLHISGGNLKGPFPTQLAERVRQLIGLLDGNTIGDQIAGVSHRPPILPVLVGVAAVGILGLSVHWGIRRRLAHARFVLFAGLVILVGSALTPGGSYPHHVLLVYPFPHLAVAAFAVELAGLARERLPAKTVSVVGVSGLAAAVLAAVAAGVLTSARIISRLDVTGGRGNFSDAIYLLDSYLLRSGPRQPFTAVDWGVSTPLVGLSQGRLRGNDVWLELSDRRFRPGTFRAELTRPETRYVLHTRADTNFPLSRERFFAVIRKYGHRARLERTIDGRDGKPVFEIYSVT
jgi:hypothetical protein